LGLEQSFNFLGCGALRQQVTQKVDEVLVLKKHFLDCLEVEFAPACHR